jgi:putative Mn2+ efflux pump MntP
MESVIILESWILLAVILGVFARNNWRRTYDLISWRNLFLGGFIHFYVLGTLFTATGTTLPEFVRLTVGAWTKLGLMLVLFLGVYFAAASFAYKRDKFTKIVPHIELPVTAPAITTAAVVLSCLAILFSFPMFNYLGAMVAQVRGQLSATAIGLATYYLIARRFNPASWMLFLICLAIGLVTSTVGTTGRRMLLSVLMVVPWIWYFASWRYRRPTSNFLRAAVCAAAGVLAILIYSPFRSVDAQRESTSSTVAKRTDQFVEILSNPKVDPEVIKYILYTDTVPNTLFILENYPGNFRFMPFHGLYWLVTNPIPRSMWPGKPEAYGGILRDQMNVVPNLGAGIIGHGWSEGWVIGVIGYALVFGLIVGGVDRALAQRAWNPYFLSVAGSCLGNVVALPRGDTALFTLQIMAGIAASALVLYCLKVFSPIWASFSVLEVGGGPTSIDEDGAATEGQHEEGDEAEGYGEPRSA